MMGTTAGWTTKLASVAGNTVTVSTSLSHPQVSLVFLRLPDGLDGRGSPATGGVSLQEVLTGQADSIQTVDGAARYTRAQMRAVLDELISEAAPRSIRTHEDAPLRAPYDDHAATGILVREAASAHDGARTLMSYRGYDVVHEQENVAGEALAAKRAALVAYGAHDPELCGPSLCPGATTEQWLRRQVGTPYAAEAAVRRWWDARSKDWVLFAEHVAAPRALQLVSAGLERNTAPAFHVPMVPARDGSRQAIHRWWSPTDRDWVDAVDTPATDASMRRFGYTDKSFQFYVESSPAPGRVALHRWWHPGDRDWLTVPADAMADAQLVRWGYTSKTLLGYVRTSAGPTPTPSASPTPTPAATPSPTPTPTATPSPTPTPTATPNLAGRTFPPTAVRRWFNTTTTDWVTVPEHGSQPLAEQLRAGGYTIASERQYGVYLVGSPTAGMVAVNRWWHPGDQDWVDMPETGTPDHLMRRYGYTSKTFQYYAWAAPAAGRVALHRWFHPVDKEWVTIRQDEISDATLRSWGYSAKTLVAHASTATTREPVYPPSTVVHRDIITESFVPGARPHTMSALDVNPTGAPDQNEGYRYLAYVAHNLCGGVYAARSDALDATAWTVDPNEVIFPNGRPCRWASAVVDGDHVALVVNEVWDVNITGQTSTDGLRGKEFTPGVDLVHEPGVRNGNPTLFRDPTTGRFHLYWYRKNGEIFEIRVKSAGTFAGLAADPRDLGTLLATSPEIVAAPSVFRAGGTYHLTVETYERGAYRTRAFTGANPDGEFFEVPENPIYSVGDACVLQHGTDEGLHNFLCHQSDSTDDSTWGLGYRRGDLPETR